MAEQDTMLHWLAQTCREARKISGRKQVHIAASQNVDQSTVNRFESATAWPRNPDKMVAAYADDLDVEPAELWEQALRLWQQSLIAAAGGEGPLGTGGLPSSLEDLRTPGAAEPGRGSLGRTDFRARGG